MLHTDHMLLVLVYLVEVVQGFVQVGVHTQRRLVGDFDRVLQNTLRDDVTLGGGRRLGADEHSEVRVAGVAVLLQLLLQGAQPLGHQMDVLDSRKERDMRDGSWIHGVIQISKGGESETMRTGMRECLSREEKG